MVVITADSFIYIYCNLSYFKSCLVGLNYLYYCKRFLKSYYSLQLSSIIEIFIFN